jgi:hypothetical protein
MYGASVHVQYLFSYNEQLGVAKQQEVPVLCYYPERASMPEILLNTLLLYFHILVLKRAMYFKKIMQRKSRCMRHNVLG